ncbi:MAG: DUF998 domain-containing protein [Thiolinea sp.]
MPYHFRLLSVLLLFLSLLAPLQARPLTPEQAPAALQPWVDWVLHDETGLDCPYRYNGAARACQWPSRLKLELDEQGGRFTQVWQVFAETRVRLPGDAQHWPQQVSEQTETATIATDSSLQADGIDTSRVVRSAALLVEEIDGLPHVRLSAGTHTLSGEFRWGKLPRSLRVTPESGLVELSINGQAVPQPDINDEGQLWLRQGPGETASEDNLDIQVFRKIHDSHPVQVLTQIRLRVSGKQRNATLGPVLLDDMIPLQLDSPLPARMTGVNQLQVQLRPGEWTLEVTGRARSDRTTFSLPDSSLPWPAEEVWVFEADSAMRQAEVQGVSSIDPNQTQLAPDWKNLPAYLLSSGQTLELKVLQRGAAETAKPQLNLQRELWLDFAGKGYTLKDRIDGYIGPQSRIDTLPALQLGRISLQGEAQFITRQRENGPAGVELRSDQLSLEAESRFTGPISAPPVNGWQQDLDRVNTTLYLPPGWRLFSVSGTDNRPGSWLQDWTLLDLFLVLVIALGTGYLFGALWGGFALLTLVFIWPEQGAPHFIWLNLLAVIALLRALPQGKLRRWLGYYRWLSLLALALIVLPYLINTIRIGLYPQLAYQHSVYSSFDQRSAPPPPPAPAPMLEQEEIAGMAMDNVLQQSAEPMVQYRPKIARDDYQSAAVSSLKKSKLQSIDPNSMVQTGPGLPDWRAQGIELYWTGPVNPDERSRLWLIGPQLNLLLQLIGIGLLLGLSGRMLSDRRRFSWTPPKWLSRQSLKLLPLLLLPALLLQPPPAQAATSDFTAIPDAQLLETLRERLTRPPECLPQCAQIEQMTISISANTLRSRLQVHAAVATAIPLPGSQDTWLARKTFCSTTSPAQALQRDADRQLWLALPAGRHDVQLRGLLPNRNSVPLPPAAGTASGRMAQ